MTLRSPGGRGSEQHVPLHFPRVVVEGQLYLGDDLKAGLVARHRLVLSTSLGVGLRRNLQMWGWQTLPFSPNSLSPLLEEKPLILGILEVEKENM